MLSQKYEIKITPADCDYPGFLAIYLDNRIISCGFVVSPTGRMEAGVDTDACEKLGIEYNPQTQKALPHSVKKYLDEHNINFSPWRI